MKNKQIISFLLFGPALITLLFQVCAILLRLLWLQPKPSWITIEFIDSLFATYLCATLFIVPLLMLTCLLVIVIDKQNRGIALKALLFNGLVLLYGFNISPVIEKCFIRFPGYRAFYTEVADSSFQRFTQCELTHNFTEMDLEYCDEPFGEDDIYFRCVYLDDAQLAHWLESNGWKRRDQELNSYNLSSCGIPEWWPKTVSGINLFEKQASDRSPLSSHDRLLFALLDKPHKTLYIRIDVLSKQ